MSNGNKLEVEITGDAKGLMAAGKQSETALAGVRKATDQIGAANAASSQAAKDYVAALQREAAQLGMTATQKRVYEAATKGASRADQDAVRTLSDKIEAHGRLEAAITRVGQSAALMAGVAGAALVKFAKDSLTAAQEAEQAALKLDAVFKASGGASGMTRGGLDSIANDMKERTGFDDDKIRGAMSRLLSFRNVGGEAFREVMNTAADLSRLLDQDLNSSVMMLGKALENPVEGLTAMTRAGVSFSESQKQAIEQMVKSGDQAGAMTDILKTLREQGINGVAEAMNTGLFKATNDLKLAWDDLLKAYGGSAAVKEAVGGFLSHMTERMKEMRKVVEGGDWLDRLRMVGSMAGVIPGGIISDELKYGNQQRRSSSGLIGRKGTREEAEAFEKQEAQRIRNQDSERERFALEFETPKQKRDRELARANALFAGRAELPSMLAAVRTKYKGAETKDELPAVMNRLSGLDPNFNKELETLHKGLDTGRLSLDGYRGAVEQLILKQPFATKDIQETIKALAEKDRVLNKVDAAEAAAADVVERAKEGNAQRVEALQLEVEMMGKNAAERARLTEFRKIDLQLEKDVEKVRTKLAGDPEGINQKHGELQRDAEAAKAAWVEAYTAIETRGRDWVAGARDGLQAYADEAEQGAARVADAFKQGAKMAEDALANFVVTGKGDISSLARFAATELARENFAKPIVSAGTSWLKGLFNGGGAASAPAASQGFGMAGDAGTLLGFAGGGDHSGGYRIVGENGPELEATGPSRIFNAGQTREILGGGAAPAPVTVNVIEDSSRGGQTQQRQGPGGGNVLDVFVSQIRSVVAGDIASGRGPIPAAMESTYGANRAAGAF